MADSEMVNGETAPSSDKQRSSETAKAGAKVDLLQPKKYKTSELPLTQDQQNAIQSLLVAFKKKGGFDNYRKKIWADFDNSVGCFMHQRVNEFCARNFTCLL
jgi:hypothetical protein